MKLIHKEFSCSLDSRLSDFHIVLSRDTPDITSVLRELGSRALVQGDRVQPDAAAAEGPLTVDACSVTLAVRAE